MALKGEFVEMKEGTLSRPKRSHMDATTALAVLQDALDRCRDADMRIAEVFAALEFLEARATHKWPFDQFRKSLDSRDPEGRWQTVNASLNAVKLAVTRK